MSFTYNIGLLVMRVHRSVKGELCMSCIHETFWIYTAVNLSIGWLGVISFFITPILLVMNTVTYVKALGMPSSYEDRQ